MICLKIFFIDDAMGWSSCAYLLELLYELAASATVGVGGGGCNAFLFIFTVVCATTACAGISPNAAGDSLLLITMVYCISSGYAKINIERVESTLCIKYYRIPMVVYRYTIQYGIILLSLSVLNSIYIICTIVQSTDTQLCGGPC